MCICVNESVSQDGVNELLFKYYEQKKFQCFISGELADMLLFRRFFLVDNIGAITEAGNS